MMVKTGFKGSMISILVLAAIATCPGASALIGPEGSAATPTTATTQRFPNQAEITAAYERSNEGNSPAAIKTLLPFAEKGNAFAQNVLGLIYLAAPDLKPDYAKALMWFRKSAALGFGGAYSNLGYMASNGLGAPKNMSDAVKWFKLATDKGNYLGQYNLGRLYETGDGIAKNPTEALRLYKLAAAQGYGQAQHNIGSMYYTGSAVPKNYAEARRNWLISSANGFGASTNYLGVMALKGEGQKADMKTAYAYFRKAAKQADTQAFFNLGVLHRDGFLGKADMVKALGFFAIAAQLGDADGKTEMEALKAKASVADRNAAESFGVRCLKSEGVDCD
jgi:uncharacterized protein